MRTPWKAQIEILASPDALAHRVAGWLSGLATASTGTFAIALSGGSTPRRLYEILAKSPWAEKFPWARTHLFWGDERFVPHDHPLSNFHMVHEALLSHVPIPAGNIHPVPVAQANPQQAAVAYERELQAFYGGQSLDPAKPLFDVTLLGLGEDGHTASLFPGTTALDEREKWAAAVVGAKSEARITLTYPALESSRHAAFLLEGSGKTAIFQKIRAGDDSFPAARLHPVGQLRWFLDKAAAGEALG